MQTLMRFGLISILLLVTAACAERVTSEVTRFHQLPPPKGGESIAIVALEDVKANSLELRAHGTLVARKLEGLGYRVVDESTGPDLLAKIDYNVSEAQSKIRRWPRRFVHYHYYYGYRYPFYYGTYWDEPYSYTYEVYHRDLDLQIVDAQGISLFEGHVSSVGRERNLNEIMPYLVDAMFYNFPGESGVTKVVTIKRGDDAAY